MLPWLLWPLPLVARKKKLPLLPPLPLPPLKPPSPLKPLLPLLLPLTLLPSLLKLLLPLLLPLTRSNQRKLAAKKAQPIGWAFSFLFVGQQHTR